MANKPTFGAYDVTFDLSKSGAQAELQKGLSSIKSTLKSFDSFFEPLLKEVERTATTVTYRAYATSDRLNQLENRIKQLQSKLGVVTGFDKELGVPERDPVIKNTSRIENAPVARDKVRIANKRDAAALRAKAAVMGSSIQPVPGGIDGEFFLNMPKNEGAVFKRAITIKNREHRENVEFSSSMSDVEKNEEKMARAEIARRKELERSRAKISALVDRSVKDPKEKKDSEGKGFRGLLETGIKLSALTFILHELLKYSKMIFAAIMETVGKARADVLASGATGIPMYKLQRYRDFGISKGLGPDVYNDSFSSVVQKFQNITKIDQGALENLALVMGPEIKDLIMSGMGGKNPDVLLEKIIKAFSARALSGKNSVGMDVGVSDAVTELTEYLRKIDPNWSSIFAIKMSDALNPVLTDRQREEAASGGLIWDSGVVTNMGNVTDLDESWLSAVKSNLDDTVSLLEQLKAIFGRWAAPMVNVMANIAKEFAMKFGTDDAKQRYYDENQQEARERLAENETYSVQIDKDFNDRMKVMRDKYGIEGLNENDIIYHATDGRVDSRIGLYNPPEKLKQDFQKDLRELMVLAAAKGNLTQSIIDLKKEADPMNDTPGDTSHLSFERIVSSSTSDALAAVSKHIDSSMYKGKKSDSPYGVYKNEENLRSVKGGEAAATKRYALERYMTSEGYKTYSSLPEQEKAKVARIQVSNQDNELRVVIVDKYGKQLGSAVTRVGLADVGSMEFEAAGGTLRNVLPTNSAGQPGAMAPERGRND